MNNVAKVQVKSRQRVQEHGEVFTNEREVNSMLDMVETETKRIESRFFEPACGDGNFLVEVLRRKIAVVTARHGGSKAEWQHYAWLSVSSIYGVDLLRDNVTACQQRLAGFACSAHEFADDRLFKDSVRYLLSKNILCGDALTLLQDDGRPITFAEWSFVRGERVKRQDYQLNHMLDANGRAGEQMDIFGGILNSEYDPLRNEMIPKAVRSYPLRNWWEVEIDG